MSIHAADALMEIFGFKRVANDEKPLDNQQSLDDDSGSLNEGMEMEESAFMKKVAGQLEFVAWEVYYRDDGSFNSITRSKDTVEEYSKMAYDIHPLCRHSEAIAGYAVRDARIAELELLAAAISADCNDMANERNQFRAELTAAKETISRYETTAENYDVLRVELANQLEVKAFWIGRTRALEVELAAIKAQEPVDGALLDYCEECSHPEFGLGYFFTDDCVRPLYAAPAAPAADAGCVLEQAMYTLISIGYHENSGLVHELRQALAACRSTGVV